MLWLLYIIGTEHHHYCIFSVLYIVTTVYIVATVFFMYLLYLEDFKLCITHLKQTVLKNR